MATTKELKEKVEKLLNRIETLEESLALKRLREGCILGGDEEYIVLEDFFVSPRFTLYDRYDGEFVAELGRDFIKKLWKAVK